MNHKLIKCSLCTYRRNLERPKFLRHVTARGRMPSLGGDCLLFLNRFLLGTSSPNKFLTSRSPNFSLSDMIFFNIHCTKTAFIGAVLLFLFPSVYKYFVALVISFWILRFLDLRFIAFMCSSRSVNNGLWQFRSTDIGWCLVLSASPPIVLRIFVKLSEYALRAILRCIAHLESEGKIDLPRIIFIEVMGAVMIMDADLSWLQMVCSYTL